MAALAGVFGLVLKPTKVSFFVWQKNCHMDNFSCSLPFALQFSLIFQEHGYNHSLYLLVEVLEWLTVAALVVDFWDPFWPFSSSFFLHFHQIQATIIRMIGVMLCGVISLAPVSFWLVPLLMEKYLIGRFVHLLVGVNNQPTHFLGLGTVFLAPVLWLLFH